MTKIIKKKAILKCLIVIVLFFAIVNAKYIQKEFLNTLYPKKYDYEVSKYSNEYNVDKNLIFAIIKAESNFNKDAISTKNAKGLMQLMYYTAKEVAKTINIEIDEEKILEPETNINIGTKYISILIDKYNNVEIALAAYNAGSGNVDNWIKNGIIQADGSDIQYIPFKETNNYVRKILRDYKIYCNL